MLPETETYSFLLQYPWGCTSGIKHWQHNLQGQKRQNIRKEVFAWSISNFTLNPLQDHIKRTSLSCTCIAQGLVTYCPYIIKSNSVTAEKSLCFTLSLPTNLTIAYCCNARAWTSWPLVYLPTLQLHGKECNVQARLFHNYSLFDPAISGPILKPRGGTGVRALCR